jgi:hypothetical protein
MLNVCENFTGALGTLSGEVATAAAAAVVVCPVVGVVGAVGVAVAVVAIAVAIAVDKPLSYGTSLSSFYDHDDHEIFLAIRLLRSFCSEKKQAANYQKQSYKNDDCTKEPCVECCT